MKRVLDLTVSPGTDSALPRFTVIVEVEESCEPGDLGLCEAGVVLMLSDALSHVAYNAIPAEMGGGSK